MKENLRNEEIELLRNLRQVLQKLRPTPFWRSLLKTIYAKNVHTYQSVVEDALKKSLHQP